MVNFPGLKQSTGSPTLKAIEPDIISITHSLLGSQKGEGSTCMQTKDAQMFPSICQDHTQEKGSRSLLGL